MLDQGKVPGKRTQFSILVYIAVTAEGDQDPNVLVAVQTYPIPKSLQCKKTMTSG